MISKVYTTESRRDQNLSFFHTVKEVKCQANEVWNLLFTERVGWGNVSTGEPPVD